MSEVISETGANTTLDELMKIVLDCAQCIEKNEQLSEMDVNGLKNELETVKERMNMNESEKQLLQDLLCAYLGLKEMSCNSERNRYEIIKNTSIPAAAYVLTDFAKYLKDPSQYVKDEKLKIKYLMNAFSILDINTSTELVKDYLLFYTNSLFCYGTELLENTDYDSVLREWVGDYEWILLYREEGYRKPSFMNIHDRSNSFHEYCDDKGPTLIVIKSDSGWIFGGYTTQSWGGGGIYIISIINL